MQANFVTRTGNGTMTTGPIRWGMISAGNIAHQFASDIKLVESARVEAVAARSGAAAQAFATHHNIPRAIEGYDALFADPSIDAIYISTPHTLHLPHSLEALRHGKAVLCEKPITVSARELDTLTRVAGDHQTYLMEAMWTWFLPAIRKAKCWVDEGRIGELLHINANFGFAKPFDPSSRLYDPELAGGCLLDMGIYPIALARRFFDGEPRSLNCVGRFAPNGVEDDVVMQFEYEQGVATLATSMRSTLPNTAYIIGTRGHIRLPQFWRAEQCLLFEDNQCIDQFDDQRKGGGFEFQIAQVSEDVLAGKAQPDIVTHSHSRSFQTDMDWVKQTIHPEGHCR